MSYRNVVAIAFAAMISTFGCSSKNLLGPTEEIVKSEANMEAGNLEVSMPLPEWLKTKLSALPASKLAGGGDPGESPLSIYIEISRTAVGGVETQRFPLIPNMASGVASGVAQVDIGDVTLRAFYHEIGQGVVDFQSKPVKLTIAPKKRYQVTFHMERVSDGNVSFSAIWDNTPEEVVVVDDTTPAPASPVLQVSPASGNPSPAVILSDADPSTYPESNFRFLSVELSSASVSVPINRIRFTRTGVSSDADVGNLYLYDGDAKLAEMYSFSDKVAVFQAIDGAGLFTVPAGAPKTISLRGDLARSSTSVSSGKTIGFNLSVASDIIPESASSISVVGSFPLVGSLMSTAAVVDLGHLYITNFGNFPLNIRPDARGEELWRFTANASSQDMQLRYLKLTTVGTIEPSEISDLRLEVNGQPISATEQCNSNKTIVFDLANNPFVIRSGQSKVLVLRGSLNGGEGKVFKFTIQRQADIVAYDQAYSVFNPVTVTGDTSPWEIIQSSGGNGTTVTTQGVQVPIPTPGDITVSIADDSPVGDVIRGATGVSLAKFSYTAHNEDILVSSVGITANMVNADQGEYSLALQNVKIVLGGAQIGTTQSQIVSSTTATTFNLDRNFIVKDGQTRVVTVVADLTNTQLERDDTITITLVPGNNALGLSSSSLLWAPRQAITARTLTVRSGVISVVNNTAFSDRSSSMPTGVPSARNVQIASFVITAGYETSSVWQIVMKDPSSSIQLGDNFQNLRLLHDNTQIGETIGSLDRSGTSATYSFDASISLRPREQYVVDVCADIMSSPQDLRVPLNPAIVLDSIGAVGVVTGYNTGLNSGQYITLQSAYISAGGRLTITTVADTPPDQVLVMGETDKEVFKFKLAAGPDEDIMVSEIYVGAVTEPFQPDGTFRNAKLFNGSTQIGIVSVWVKWPAPFSTNYYMVTGFSGLSLVVPRNSSITLTLKVDVNTAENATSGFGTVLYLLPDYDGMVDGDQPSIVARGMNSAMSLTGDALKFQGAGGLGTGVLSNMITVYATKISVAWARSDTLSVRFAPQAGQVVAKFTITNSDNAGRYSANIRGLKLAITASGVSVKSQTNLNVYKDTMLSGNIIGTTSWFSGASITGVVDLNLDHNLGFNELEIAAGQSKTFIVTLDTNNLEMARMGFPAISISIPSDGVSWQDGVGTGNITTAEGLPLSTKTLYY